MIPYALKWFRPGRCRLCGRWSLWGIMRSEDAHEQCWLESK